MHNWLEVQLWISFIYILIMIIEYLCLGLNSCMRITQLSFYQNKNSSSYKMFWKTQFSPKFRTKHILCSQQRIDEIAPQCLLNNCQPNEGEYNIFSLTVNLKINSSIYIFNKLSNYCCIRVPKKKKQIVVYILVSCAKFVSIWGNASKDVTTF